MVDERLGGSIVAVSSISGTLADRDMGAYCVSKAGIDMLVRVAAAEWGAHGIRVNAVGPGVTRTPMLANPSSCRVGRGLTERTALGRLGEADDVAEAIVAVLEMSWVTGQIVFADGGLALHSPIDAYGRSNGCDTRHAGLVGAARPDLVVYPPPGQLVVGGRDLARAEAFVGLDSINASVLSLSRAAWRSDCGMAALTTAPRDLTWVRGVPAIAVVITAMATSAPVETATAAHGPITCGRKISHASPYQRTPSWPAPRQPDRRRSASLMPGGNTTRR
jgi:hypothetical protein